MIAWPFAPNGGSSRSLAADWNRQLAGSGEDKIIWRTGGYVFAWDTGREDRLAA